MVRVCKGRWMEQNAYLLEATEDFRLGWRMSFQQDTDPNHAGISTIVRFRSKHIIIIEWLSQNIDLKYVARLKN